MLCTHAIRNYEKFGTRLDPVTNTLVQRGVLINYDSLPGYVPQLLLPLFGISPLPAAWLLKLTEESNYYSKSRGTKIRTFKSDSKDKDSRATEQIQLYAEKILAPTYKLLEEKAQQSLLAISPNFIAEVTARNGIPVEQFTWKTISVLPKVSDLPAAPAKATGEALLRGGLERVEGGDKEGSAGSGEGSSLPGTGHSSVLKVKEFLPWAPFANHHSSRPIQVSTRTLV